MIIKYLFIVLIMVYSQLLLSKNSINHSDLSPQNVDKLLLKAEETRKSNTELFTKLLQNISQLKSQTIFTEKQNCHYDYLLSFSLAYANQYELAQNKLQKIFESCKDFTIQIKSKLLMSNLNVISKNYGKAISDLNFVLEEVNNIDDIKLKHLTYSIASLVYRLVEQPELSIRFTNLLLADNPDDLNKCSGLVNKYRLLLQDGFHEEYTTDIQSTLSLCESNNEFIQSNFLKIDWMNAQLEQKPNKQKVEHLLSQLQFAQKQIKATGYQNLISVMDNLFAKIYWKLGNALLAIKYAHLSLSESQGIKRTKQEVSSYQILIDYYKSINDTEKVIEYLEKQSHSKLLDYNDKQVKLMAYQTVNHENFAKNKQIELLNQQNKVLALEKAVSKKSAQVQKLITLFLIVITSFFIFWGLWQRRNQKKYKELSERDHMTSIFNRNGLRQNTESLLAFSHENGKEVGCALFDLDWFKKINDKYGHATGDWAIKNVIKKCQSLGNNKATFGRLGGEEFAIILSDANKEEMYVFCENCRNAINNLVTKESGHEFKISASFGMTTSAVSGLSYSALLIHADNALYKAKNSGRNNTVIYQQETKSLLSES